MHPDGEKLKEPPGARHTRREDVTGGRQGCEPLFHAGEIKAETLLKRKCTLAPPLLPTPVLIHFRDFEDGRENCIKELNNFIKYEPPRRGRALETRNEDAASSLSSRRGWQNSATHLSPPSGARRTEPHLSCDGGSGAEPRDLTPEVWRTQSISFHPK